MNALSRAPSSSAEDTGEVKGVEEVQLFANSVTTGLPASGDRLTAYHKAQQKTLSTEDTVRSQLMELYPETRQY